MERYTREEGGTWFDVYPRSTGSTDAGLVEIATNFGMHSFVTEDGRIWDEVNGWNAHDG
jgi:hypothetical protein